MEKVLQAPVGRNQNRGFILGSLAFGHGIAHLYSQGMPLFMPAIASSLGLSNLQVASLLGVRMAGDGAINLGTGVFVDMIKSQWGLLLTACMAWSAIAYMAVGAAPNFALLIIAMALVAVPGSLWHLPATAALSRRFPDRRGFAISIHGFGSSIGNVLGPLVAGALLTVMVYRTVLFIYAIPTLGVAVFVWMSLRDIGRDEGPSEQRSLRAQFLATKEALKSPIVLTLMLLAVMSSIGFEALFQWTPFYLKEELGMGHFSSGVHFALLTGMGIISAPVLGGLSDKLGRKRVMVPGLIAAAVLSLLVVSVGDSILLAVVFAGLGLFSFSLQQIMLAAILDLAGRGTEAATVGLMFGFYGIIGAGSPFIATVVIDHLGGYGSIYYYAGVLAAVSGFLVMMVPMAEVRTASTRTA